ncbi:MAG: Rne/Rng family ribonuclease [Alphaproteobacteria bacterium]|nr:Rne/Rng family ribonuclease [Alphaproteobacteria bacterium]
MKKMLIDATSQSEIRLAIVNEKKLENYEFEPRPSKYTKGNIYLAKVIRIEPSLQAAFVEYADNTQGFLPFSEIHPDYFRIPVEDYEALMAEQREERRQAAEASLESDVVVKTESSEVVKADAEDAREDSSQELPEDAGTDLAETDLDEDEGSRPLVFTPKIAQRYKIQEVIKHGQLVLVQVIKEERGNKRAALSTYIALAGCYCVLIPNTLFNGGVSRKIESTKERKRLKKILTSIEIPDGMALILRTAAEGKTKASINRELKYLQNFWDELRQRTMNSVAPLLIHEEGDLINRSLRDIFSKQIEEVYIAGAEAFKQAKDFTKLLNPKLSRSITEFSTNGRESLFESFGLEAELQNLVVPEVVMPSGGVLVIEQTEALVSIDINSGKAIGERNIEETALKINLEAAEEIARQLRLRNLAGLIMIDFIDMGRRGSQQKVERVLKAALKNDKARIHVGKISYFGLMEMSRQRLGPSILEKTTDLCPQCHGHGRVLHQDGMVAALLRALHQRMVDGGAVAEGTIAVHCLPDVAQRLLNDHTGALRELEEQYGVKMVFVIDPTLHTIYGWSLEGCPQQERRDRSAKRRERNNDRHQDRNEHQGGRQRAVLDEVQPDSDETTSESGLETRQQRTEEGRRRRRRNSGRNRKSGEAAESTAKDLEASAETQVEVSVETTSAKGEATEGTAAEVRKVEISEEKAATKPKRKRRYRKSKDESTGDSVSTTEPAAEVALTTKNNTQDAQPIAKAENFVEYSAPVVRGKPQPDATAAIKPERKGWWNLLSS